MRGLLLAVVTGAILAFTAFTFGYATGPASAHRHGCHRWHTCPSDHATYRWRSPSGRSLLCVAPYSDKRNSTFRLRVVYGGRTYWCKR